MKKIIFFSVLISVFAVFLANAASDYKIGPKDIIRIAVFKLEELNTEARVSESGYIAIPLLGKIKVQGLTSIELEEKLSKELEKKYLQNPQVTVFIKEYISNRVFIIGAVNRAGSYSILGKNTLLQMLALAGGLSEFIAGDKILIIRGDKKVYVKMTDLFDDFKPESNIEIMPNDLIIIPQERTRYIYVIGQVKFPGLTGIKKSGCITLLEAIARAGGFTEKASKSNVILHRKINGKIKIFKFNMKDILFGKNKDFEVKESDIIYIKESIF